jgi:outer membrane protein OmpA-like peptidoglycan-associated protein
MMRFRLAVLAVAATAAISWAGPASAQTITYCQRNTMAAQGYPGPYNAYFDVGKSVLRPAEKKLIAEIAQRAKDLYVTSICVIGFADKQGNKVFNKQLSMDRARAVAAELMRNGIPGKNIVIDGEGEPYKDWNFGKIDDQQRDRRAAIILAK